MVPRYSFFAKRNVFCIKKLTFQNSFSITPSGISLKKDFTVSSSTFFGKRFSGIRPPFHFRTISSTLWGTDKSPFTEVNHKLLRIWRLCFSERLVRWLVLIDAPIYILIKYKETSSKVVNSLLFASFYISYESFKSYGFLCVIAIYLDDSFFRFLHVHVNTFTTLFIFSSSKHLSIPYPAGLLYLFLYRRKWAYLLFTQYDFLIFLKNTRLLLSQHHQRCRRNWIPTP